LFEIKEEEEKKNGKRTNLQDDEELMSPSHRVLDGKGGLLFLFKVVQGTEMAMKNCRRNTLIGCLLDVFYFYFYFFNYFPFSFLQVLVVVKTTMMMMLLMMKAENQQTNTHTHTR